MKFPEDVRYTTEHEWVKIDGKVATVGISDYAQDQLGDIVFLELPEVGETFQKNDTFGVVESTKSVSDLYAPLNGKVIECNDSLLESPEIINEDPFGEGWMIKLELSQPEQAEALLNAQAYQKLIEEEAS